MAVWKNSGTNRRLTIDTATQGYTPPDIRFPVKGSSLYAIALGWPKDGQWIVHSLGSATAIGGNAKVGDVVLGGLGAKLRWTQEAEGLHINLPAEPPGEHAYAFRASLASSTSP